MLTFLHSKPTNMLWPLALKITPGFWWRGVLMRSERWARHLASPTCRAFFLCIEVGWDAHFHLWCLLGTSYLWNAVYLLNFFFLCKNTVSISAILFSYLCAKLRAHRTVSGESITKASRATYVFKINHDTGLSLLFSFHVWPSDSLVETSIECQTCGEFTLL